MGVMESVITVIILLSKLEARWKFLWRTQVGGGWLSLVCPRGKVALLHAQRCLTRLFSSSNLALSWGFVFGISIVCIPDGRLVQFARPPTSVELNRPNSTLKVVVWIVYRYVHLSLQRFTFNYYWILSIEFLVWRFAWGQLYVLKGCFYLQEPVCWSINRKLYFLNVADFEEKRSWEKGEAGGG